jgi:ligand-binding SRPBCC domain-containing protein
MSHRSIARSTHLPAAPEDVWEFAMQTATLHHVAAPLLRFEPEGRPLPRRWRAGAWRVRLRGPLGLPLGWQEIRVSFPDVPPPLRQLRDEGRGALVRRWDHVIEIAPDGEGTRYTDKLEIEAGALTPLIALAARGFYAHRQRRWRRMLNSGRPRRDRGARPPA